MNLESEDILSRILGFRDVVGARYDPIGVTFVRPGINSTLVARFDATLSSNDPREEGNLHDRIHVQHKRGSHDGIDCTSTAAMGCRAHVPAATQGQVQRDSGPSRI